MEPTPVTPGAPAGRTLAKTPTGIGGLDEVTGGGLPRGRTTLVSGGAGCGKTLLGMQFLVDGIREYDEPGAFIAFEETAEELTENVRSLGYDLDALVARKQLALDHVRVERSEIEETGDYDLEALFVRIGHAIASVGARRVVIDTLEVLFAGLENHGVVRAELRRLFRWLKERGVTAIVTAERGPSGSLTRHGLEEYVSDCVIVLDHRMDEQISTRRLRVVKYRGSSHGANEYPFLIGEGGLVVYPITSLRLDHPAPGGRVSTGIPELDEALAGGLLSGSSVLVTGAPGTGKTSIAASFAHAACKRGDRCVYFSMEESPDQIVHHMRSIGLDLESPRKEGRLHLRSARSTLYGLETHLAQIYHVVSELEPQAVVMDPITNLDAVGSDRQVTAAIMRLLDFLKTRRITAVFTALTSEEKVRASSGVSVSSWMDTWINLRTLESRGRRARSVYVVKARGTAHSDRIHSMQFTSGGIRIGSPVDEVP